MMTGLFSRGAFPHAVLSIFVFVSCDPKYRNFGSIQDETLPANPENGDLVVNGAASDSGPDTSGAQPGAMTRELIELGAACVNDSECTSGYCVDGVCCDSRCGELCATCVAVGNEGRCVAAATDLACDVLTCPGTTECRGRDQMGVAFNCEGIGACRTNIDCAPIDQPEGIECQAGTGRCDGDGVCVVPDKAVLGEPCTTGADCAEANCVVGAAGTSICCDAPCDGVCETCSAEGRCDVVPANDDRCQPVTCPPDNPCRDFDDSITGDLCRGIGRCKTQQDCRRRILKPDASCECDLTDDCRLRPGASCESGAACGSGNCQATTSGILVCCTAACGAGLLCASDGRGCVECEGEDVTCQGSTAISCEGGRLAPENCANGCTPGVGCNERAPVGFSCASSACALDLVCQDDTGGTRRCCARDCAVEGKQCAPDGSCVCPAGQTQGTGTSCLLQRGDPCGSGPAQCGAGLTCVDGVCCDEACDGACESCSLQGTRGTCAFDSRDVNQCAAGEQCVGRDDCRGGLRAPCDAAVDCVSNNCEPLVGISGNSICCSAPCSGQRPSCSTNGSSCVACQVDGDCENGACIGADAPGAFTCICDPGFKGLTCALRACGDRSVDSGETCDDGNTVSGDGCSSICSVERSNGSECDADNQCQSGRCLDYYLDADGDGVAPLSETNRPLRFCTVDGFSIPQRTSLRPTGLQVNTDCCDSDALVNAQFSSIENDPNACGHFDWDCSGVVETLYPNARLSPCSLITVPFLCDTALLAPGGEELCGEEIQLTSCRFVAGSGCTTLTVTSGRDILLCH